MSVQIVKNVADLQRFSGSAKTQGADLRELVAALDRAVAPALRGDVPELAQINGLWSTARRGLGTQSAFLGNVSSAVDGYQRETAAIEMTRWALKQLKKRLEKRFAANSRLLKALQRYIDQIDADIQAQKTLYDRIRPKKRRKGGGKRSAKRSNPKKAAAREADGKLKTLRGNKATAEEAMVKARKASKILGRASFAVDAGLAGVDQWQDDAGSHRSKKEKAVRAAVVGTTTAAGSAAGAAALGTAFSVVPVVGTATGVVVGGYLGGKAGNFVGHVVIEPKKTAKAAVNKVKDVGGKVKDAGGKVKDVGKDAAKGAAKGVKKLGEKITPW